MGLSVIVGEALQHFKMEVVGGDSLVEVIMARDTAIYQSKFFLKKFVSKLLSGCSFSDAFAFHYRSVIVTNERLQYSICFAKVPGIKYNAYVVK